MSGSSAGHFYPRPPRGGRHAETTTFSAVVIFLSTPSARRATSSFSTGFGWVRNFYPRPPRGGRLSRFLRTRQRTGISIHALREEGDHCLSKSRSRHEISIHALREEGDGGAPLNVGLYAVFLSTPSARRATAKTETKSLFSYKLYNILHEFRRALIYNGSKNYPNHAK